MYSNIDEPIITTLNQIIDQWKIYDESTNQKWKNHLRKAKKCRHRFGDVQKCAIIWQDEHEAVYALKKISILKNNLDQISQEIKRTECMNCDKSDRIKGESFNNWLLVVVADDFTWSRKSFSLR